jgi:hypothetical protein
MNQLKLGTIMNIIDELSKSGMTTKEISSLPIYIGDDGELNGIHTAWFVQTVRSDKEDDEGFIELINERRGNIPFNKIAILIS